MKISHLIKPKFFIVSVLTLALSVVLLSVEDLHASSKSQCNKYFLELDKPAVINTGKKGGISKFLRTNPPYKWWITKKKLDKQFRKLPKEIRESLLTVATIIGDFHLRNVAIVISKLSARLGVADKDDGGRGPIYIDFLHTVSVSTHAIQVKVKHAKKSLVNLRENYFDSYFEGAKLEREGRASDIFDFAPKWLMDSLNIPPLKLKEIMKRYVEKRTETDDSGNLRIKLGGELFSPRNTKRATPEMLQKFNNEAYLFQSYLNRQHIKKEGILDIALRVKEGGGSGGSLRFVFLTKNRDGDLELWEFKPLKDEGYGSSMYMTQADQITRVGQIDSFNNYIQSLINGRSDMQSFDRNPIKERVFTSNATGISYHLRVKGPGLSPNRLVDRPQNEKEAKMFEEYTRFLAMLYGGFHAQNKKFQPALDKILSDKDLRKKVYSESHDHLNELEANYTKNLVADKNKKKSKKKKKK